MQLEEHSLIKLFLNRKYYEKYCDHIDMRVLPREMKDILKVIFGIFKDSEQIQNLTCREVFAMYKSTGSRTEAYCSIVKEILAKVHNADAISDEVAEQVLNKYYEQEAARKIAEESLKTMQHSEGAKSLSELMEYISDIGVLPTDDKNDSIVCTTDLKEVLELQNKAGHFRFSNGLDELSSKFGSPGKGNFVIIFATPNVGKSTFVAQLSVGYLQQGLRVTYFGNEEPMHKIVVNHIRSCLGKSDVDLPNSDSSAWDKIKDNLIPVSCHDMGTKEIIEIVDKTEPDIVIIDQLDNVLRKKGDDLYVALEVLYQHARGMACQKDCLVIAVSQASNDASGQLVLKPNMMANSKIGKTGAADLILGIGMKDITDTNRGITAVKNKLTGVHDTVYMQLDNKIARYIQ